MTEIATRVLFIALALGALRRTLFVAAVLRSQPTGARFLIAEFALLVGAFAVATFTLVSPDFVRWGATSFAATWIGLALVDSARRRLHPDMG
jgi:hypothetical protein